MSTIMPARRGVVNRDCDEPLNGPVLPNGLKVLPRG